MLDKRGVITAVASACLFALIMGYVNLNIRVKALEIQVDTMNVAQKKANDNIQIVIDKVSDIQLKVTRLGDLKADKKYIE